MRFWHTVGCLTNFLLIGLWTCFAPDNAIAYIASPPTTLGSMFKESTHVIIVKVEILDRDKNVIIWRKLRDVKGKWPSDLVKQNIGGETPDKEVTAARKYIMKWAEIGKTTVMFAQGSNKWGRTYIDQQWYCGPSADWQWWSMSHGEPLLRKVYTGKADDLVTAIEAIAARKEVIVPCMVEGKIRQMRASLKLLDFNPKRDAVE